MEDRLFAHQAVKIVFWFADDEVNADIVDAQNRRQLVGP